MVCCTFDRGGREGGRERGLEKNWLLLLYWLLGRAAAGTRRDRKALVDAFVGKNPPRVNIIFLKSV